MIEDGIRTATSQEQHALEQRLALLYEELHRDAQALGSHDSNTLSRETQRASATLTDALELQRSKHIEYLHGGLQQLPAGFASLDSGRPWICFWVIHSLALLKAPLPEGLSRADVIQFLSGCQAASGGFGGGPCQLAHLAPTYAAVASLVSLGGEDALRAVNRPALLSFVHSMCVPAEQGGGLSVCQGGEVDCRGCYTALAALHMLGLDPSGVLERSDLVSFVWRCQTYEGGLGGEPGAEAHGGYTFCGLAALHLAGRADALSLPALLHWAVHRQGLMEGGFMGRTNKLVDGCYSYWQGALFPLLQQLWPLYMRQLGLPRAPPLPKESAPLPAPPMEAAIPSLPIAAQPPPQQAAAEAKRMQDLAGVGVSIAQQRGVSAGDARLAAQRATEQSEALRYSAAALCPAAASNAPSTAACRSNQPSDGADGADQSAPQLYNTRALRLWLLKCCQASRGGLRDKPGKPVDYYHTCYCLSGLAACQAYAGVQGGDEQLAAIDPVCNVVASKLAEALAFFRRSELSA